MERLRQICAAFDCGGAALSFEEIQVGHVNRSYKVFLDSGDVCVLRNRLDSKWVYSSVFQSVSAAIPLAGVGA